MAAFKEHLYEQSGGKTYVTLQSNTQCVITGIRREDLTLEEIERLKRLVEVLDWNGNRLVVRRNRFHRVGRVSIGDFIVTVPPEFDPHLFATFYLYASGADLSNFISRQAAPIASEYKNQSDVFLTLLAHLFVQTAEKVLSLGVARTYEQNVERLRLIQGRPLWDRDFGHHVSEGITCRNHVLTTDNLPNQLMVAGLNAATLLLRHSSSNAYNQLFTWRSLASAAVPSITLFERAQYQLTRLTAHYQPALMLARALTIGFSPSNLFGGNSGSLQVIEFDLPVLFERFLERLVVSVGKSLGLEVQKQERDNAAIIDGYGHLYRQIRPDLVIYRDGKPVAVIDAKYKPRYVSYSFPSGAGVPADNRVTNEDIYQMCFYQTRLQLRYKSSFLPVALLVAPQISDAEVHIDVEARTIRWRASDAMGETNTDDFGLTLIALPMKKVLSALKDGLPEREALSQSGSLLQALSKL